MLPWSLTVYSEAKFSPNSEINILLTTGHKKYNLKTVKTKNLLQTEPKDKMSMSDVRGIDCSVEPLEN